LIYSSFGAVVLILVIVAGIANRIYSQNGDDDSAPAVVHQNLP
jgi:hypothetical protein